MEPSLSASDRPTTFHFGRQVAAGLGDADDRFARLQFLARQTEVQIALQIQRRHVGIAGIVEPGTASQRLGRLADIFLVISHLEKILSKNEFSRQTASCRRPRAAPGRPRNPPHRWRGTPPHRRFPAAWHSVPATRLPSSKGRWCGWPESALWWWGQD